MFPADWILDFLQGRKQVVRFNSRLLSVIVNTGVPEGRDLSPRLNSFYTNNSPSATYG